MRDVYLVGAKAPSALDSVTTINSFNLITGFFTRISIVSTSFVLAYFISNSYMTAMAFATIMLLALVIKQILPFIPTKERAQ